jgi:hypothetical protein
MTDLYFIAGAIVSSRWPSPTRTPANDCAEATMTDIVWLSAVTLFVFGYGA